MTDRPRTHTHARATGFATLVTVAMLFFVAMAVMTMTRLTVLDARRTQQAKAESQRRQWLLAGTAAAQARLEHEPAFIGTFTVDLPVETQRPGVSLTVQITEADEQRAAVVQVAHDDQKLHQTLRFTPNGNRWSVTSVSIDRLR